MKIYLDVDNTVIDSLSMNVELLNEKFGTHVDPKDIHRWDFTDCFPDIKSKDIYETFDSDDFFDRVMLIDGAYDFIMRHKDDIVFTTIGTPRNLEKKAELLDMFGFGDCRFLGIPTYKTKGDYDMSNGVIVDDAQKNLYASNAKAKVLFNYRMDFTADWNCNWYGLFAMDYDELEHVLYGE
jgi:5'(3')-deoxyribonucleotidase